MEAGSAAMWGEVTVSSRWLVAAFAVVVILTSAAAGLATHRWASPSSPPAGPPPEPAVRADPAGEPVAAEPGASTVAAAPLDGGATAAAEAEPAPAPAPVSGPFTADFGAFATAEQAQAMATALAGRGLPATVLTRADAAGRVWHHAVSGSFATRTRAAAAADAFALAFDLASAPLALTDAAP